MTDEVYVGCATCVYVGCATCVYTTDCVGAGAVYTTEGCWTSTVGCGTKSGTTASSCFSIFTARVFFGFLGLCRSAYRMPAQSAKPARTPRMIQGKRFGSSFGSGFVGQ